jgi:hypothetical protein
LTFWANFFSSINHSISLAFMFSLWKHSIFYFGLFLWMCELHIFGLCSFL